MVEEQMAYRCPNARLIGMGQLPNHRLEFYLHATVERSRAHGASVPVAVWEIDEEDEKNLDHYEGFPKYYTKHKRKVVMDDGSQIEGMVYIMNMIRPLIPHASYYNGIRDAYLKLGIGSEIKRVLEPALNRSIKRDRFRLR
jgi:gamma-glutamylcyclotransferase (GGCT)/AIG2-like uncharacterized protein YtfP